MSAGCYNTLKEGVRLVRFPKTTNKDESGQNKSRSLGSPKWFFPSCVLVILEQTALKMSQNCAGNLFWATGSQIEPNAVHTD